MFKRTASLVWMVMVCGTPAMAHGDDTKIQWQDWSDGVFETARKEHKLVLLDVRAVWCHWCHVMDDTTYRDKDIINLINRDYIAVSVDQDSHPGLSHRYEDYGWPATIIFAADGTEIVKRRGYIDKDTMQVVLQESFDNPVPNPHQTHNFDPSSHAGLTENQRETILSAIVAVYDKANGGWGDGNKYLDAPLMQFTLDKTYNDNPFLKSEAEDTLKASLGLIDPVWGGVYQYSDSPDWKSAHFEKILSIQSAYITSYAYAYGVLQDAQYRDAAGNVIKYLDAFMTSPEGGFYTSQDADVSETVNGHSYYSGDDVQRRKIGLPRIDKNIYTNENGAMVSALLTMYSMTGDKTALDKAERAMQWLLKNRFLPEGGFKHGDSTKDGPFLADTLNASKAMLDLYATTADRKWLTHAEEGARFISKTFADSKDGGFFTQAPREGDVLKSYKEADENAAAARFLNLLSYYSADKSFKKTALSTLQSIASPEQVKHEPFEPDILLADDELRKAPLHLTVVGHKDDVHAAELFKAALALPPLYKQTQWMDKREGKLPGSDIEFPDLPDAAIFVCTNTTCSLPLNDVKALKDEIMRTLSQ